MKKMIAFIPVICLLLLASCQALKHITFYQEFHESGTIPQQTLTSATDSITTPDIPTNVAAQLKANNTSPDLVQSVEMQTLTLTITAPAGQTFAALQDVQLFILTDSLPAVEIASKHNIISTSNVLNMDVDATELKPYLLGNSFKLRYIITSRAAVTQSLTLDMYMKVRFQANLLAAL